MKRIKKIIKNRLSSKKEEPSQFKYTVIDTMDFELSFICNAKDQTIPEGMRITKRPWAIGEMEFVLEQLKTHKTIMKTNRGGGNFRLWRKYWNYKLFLCQV